MAKLYGTTNRLSQSFALTYGLIVLAAIAFGIFAVVNFVYSGSWQAFVFLALLLVVLYLVYRNAGFRLRVYLQGMAGERTIADMLEADLPDTYTVYRGAVIDYTRGDIDCIVLGPTGLFTVEVKSHKGNMELIGTQLTRNRKPFEKNFLGQTKSEALTLRDFLARTQHVDVFVKAVLVFSSDRAAVHIPSAPIAGVSIVSAKNLVHFVLSQPEYHFPVPMATIEAALVSVL